MGGDVIGAEPIRVGGLTYWEIKQRAMNGGRSKLSEDQLGFVGIDALETSEVGLETSPTWLQPVNPSNIDDRLEQLASLMDRAPNYLALAREILNEK